MTEELTPEFLEFSQMLDEGEGGAFPEEAALLTELGQTLRHDRDAEGLTEEERRELLTGVLSRHAELGWMERTGDLLVRTFARRAGLAHRTSLVLGGIAAAFLDPTGILLAFYGVVLGLLGGGSLLRVLFDSGDGPVLKSNSVVFFLLPCLALLTFGFALAQEMGGLLKLSPTRDTTLILGSLLAGSSILALLGLGRKTRLPRAFNALLQIFSGAVGCAFSLRLLDVIVSDYFWTTVPRNHPSDSPEAGGVIAIWGTLTAIVMIISLAPRNDISHSPCEEGALSRSKFHFLGALYYLLPLCAALATGVLSCVALNALGKASLAFRGSGDAQIIMAVLTGIGVTVLFHRAMAPLWRVARNNLVRQPFKSAVCLLGAAVWIGLTTFLTVTLSREIGENFTAEQAIQASEIAASIGLGLALFVGLLSFLISRHSNRDSKVLPYLPAVKKAAINMALSLLPLLLVMLVFYQMHLVRSIHSERYLAIIEESESYFNQRRLLRDDENAWVELRPYLYQFPKRRMDSEAGALRKRLLDYNLYENGMERDYQALLQEPEYLAARDQFIEEFRKLESALEKPDFSTLPEFEPKYDLGADHQPINWILVRAVSQNLDLLVEESIAQGNTDSAVRYGIKGLRWARLLEGESAIALMIRIAQLAIAHSSLEDLVVEGDLTDSQLQLLASETKESKPRPESFANAMKRESYLTDEFFQNVLLSDNPDRRREVFFKGTPALVRLLPSSYWESERNAYWNFQLARAGNWEDLSLQKSEETLDISPFHVASSTFAPDMGRAQLQFCFLHSKLSALELSCHLERYKLKYGQYPASLNDLTPEFTDTLPPDLMNPRKLDKKPTFDYRLTPAGYVLLSNSPAYSWIHLEPRQVYGHYVAYGAKRRR